jgi:hypothetical protein
MKKLLSIITTIAFAASLSAVSVAAEKKKPATDKPAVDKPAAVPAEKPAEPAPAPEKVVGESKAIPLYTEVSSIETAGKSFTHKNKDGKEVKFVVTDTTEIKNAGAAAKLEDIKVGDSVSGLRKKVSETEYTVLKITKFGPKAPPSAEAKPAEAKPAEKK